MSNSIRAKVALTVAALFLVACDRPAERDAPPLRVAASNPPVPRQIDPAPFPAPASRIAAQRDIQVNGEPACALTVRYPGAVDQPVTWRGEPCSAIRVQSVTLGDLERIGQAGKLGDDAREDLARTDSGRAIYVEGEYASALYPMNVAGRIYRVPLAD
jgi:hypothetical protein